MCTKFSFQRGGWNARLFPPLLFLLFFAYFFFGTGWYEPARLVIEGTAPGTDAVINVQWDSGNGYNEYEQEHFSFLPFRGSSDRPLNIVVSGGTEKNDLSRGNRVVLKELRLDDNQTDISKHDLLNVHEIPETGWSFNSADSKISLDVPVENQVYFSLATNDPSGKVRISINGFERVHDLYLGNWEILQTKLNYWLLNEQGEFSVWQHMPRYAVKFFRISNTHGAAITSISLQTKSGRIVQLPLPESQADGQLLIAEPTKHLKRYFHVNRILYQILFAFLLSWMICFFRKLFICYGGIKSFFFSKEFLVFWLFFIGSVVVYSIYLAAFWPGLMSVDSLAIWRAAWLPEVMINNHPMLNVIWYTFLIHLWGNVAVVPISQILLLSLLIAATFFFCYRNGIKLLWLLPCYLSLLISIPVGLYNVTLWKDVPFALLVVFWSLTLVYFLFQKKRDTEKGSEESRHFRLKWPQLIILSGLFLALILFRHNGIIYLVALPSIFIALRLVRVAKIYIFSGGIGATVILLFVIFPPDTVQHASYFHDQMNYYLQKVTTDSSLTGIQQNLYKYFSLLDAKKNSKKSNLWHNHLGDRYAYTFLRQTGWHDTYRYSTPEFDSIFPEFRDFALKVYNKSLESPWIYFSWNPFWILYLFPLSILLYRWFPLSALFSTVILVQVIALLFFIGTVNWRYYYFVLLGGHFFLPVVLLDIRALLLRRKMVAGVI